MILQQEHIRPFHANVSEAELTELRRRINAKRWPERETVTDASQGVQLATTQKLARYPDSGHRSHFQFPASFCRMHAVRAFLDR
jgi:hypothetical protein